MMISMGVANEPKHKKIVGFTHAWWNIIPMKKAQIAENDLRLFHAWVKRFDFKRQDGKLQVLNCSSYQVVCQASVLRR